MTQLIIHPGTGTIVVADECIVLSIDDLSPEDAAIIESEDDIAIVDLALRIGTLITEEI